MEQEKDTLKFDCHFRIYGCPFSFFFILPFSSFFTLPSFPSSLWVSFFSFSLSNRPEQIWKLNFRITYVSKYDYHRIILGLLCKLLPLKKYHYQPVSCRQMVLAVSVSRHSIPTPMQSCRPLADTCFTWNALHRGLTKSC